MTVRGRGVPGGMRGAKEVKWGKGIEDDRNG